MGSGSFLGRETLVQIPDVFLTSPQFLHRAFLFRIKSISVNKWMGHGTHPYTALPLEVTRTQIGAVVPGVGPDRPITTH